MISSMTGYGKAQRLIDGKDIGVELRAVNHRYFEFSTRLPRQYGFLEEKLKSYVRDRVSRGKVDLNVSMVTLGDASDVVELNRPLARGYLEALRKLGGELGVEDDVTLSVLARFHDIFVIRRSEQDEEDVWQAVRQVAQEAMERFLAMRAVEGEKLRQDIEHRLDLILNCVEGVERRSPRVLEEYRARLYAKLCDILENPRVDEQRMLTEAALFAEKTDVSEETVRLRSHLSQLRSILKDGRASGRKLDFLVQELNREANTIGSKGQDIEIARLVVDMKSEIEKMREQIQNIE